jgi:hypothetical protein
MAIPYSRQSYFSESPFKDGDCKHFTPIKKKTEDKWISFKDKLSNNQETNA